MKKIRITFKDASFTISDKLFGDHGLIRILFFNLFKIKTLEKVPDRFYKDQVIGIFKMIKAIPQADGTHKCKICGKILQPLGIMGHWKVHSRKIIEKEQSTLSDKNIKIFNKKNLETD